MLFTGTHVTHAFVLLKIMNTFSIASIERIIPILHIVLFLQQRRQRLQLRAKTEDVYGQLVEIENGIEKPMAC